MYDRALTMFGQTFDCFLNQEEIQLQTIDRNSLTKFLAAFRTKKALHDPQERAS